MNDVLLSIIVPLYKVEMYVEKCLTSILEQDLFAHKVELIVVNDGSPDKSAEIAGRIIKNTDCAYLINQENQGLSAARNAGLKMAHGRYVWFVDSDDSILPRSLDYIEKMICNNSEVDVFASVLRKKNELTGFEQNEKDPILLAGLMSGKEYIQRNHYIGASQRFIIRKQLLDEYGLFFYPGIYHEDGLFGYQLLYLSQKVLVLDKPIYLYLLRSTNSIMSSFTKKNFLDNVLVHKKLVAFNRKYVSEDDKKWFMHSIYSCIMFSYFIYYNLKRSKENRIAYKKEWFYMRKQSFLEMVRGNFLKGLFFFLLPKAANYIKHRR